MNEILDAIWIVLPAYIANMTACTFGGGRPVDLNKHFVDGKRLIGDGVTVRGTVAGVFFGTLTCAVQSLFFQYSFLFSIEVGVLLSFGALLGDFLESFFKRRIRIQRGSPLPLLDQLDFIFGALILSFPLLDITPQKILIILLITPTLHFSTNYIGYKLRLKEVPW
ncbi:MAG: CDP-2,3-bis-(O-geranylgeranyl)-sn-glycerol synthase [Euryarchaeota archaeon]|nr:CDP-2,3-bis-(O-geranylgeranyl)-sn-glycerol synthase [Euryarchaeota archaeon]